MKFIFSLSLATLLSVGSLFAAPFGEQISESGITHSFLLTGQRTIIVDENNEIQWDAGRKSRDGEVLENGNILIAYANEVIEYGPEKKVVFRYALDPANKEISTGKRLKNGNTLIVEMGAKPRLMEVKPDGGIAVEFPLQPETNNTHMQTRMARKLDNGNYLVPHLLAFAIKEYTPKGKVVRTIKTDLPALGGRDARTWPFTAIVLEGGDVFVNLTNGNQAAVFGPEGELKWHAKNDEAGNRFADPCGGQVLANGNRVICAYGQGDQAMPDLFELTPDKKVVWEYKNPNLSGAHEVHVLSTKGKPTDRPARR